MRYQWIGFLAKIDNLGPETVPLSDLTEIKYTPTISTYEPPVQLNMRMGVFGEEAKTGSWYNTPLPSMPPVIYLHDEYQDRKVFYDGQHGYLKLVKMPNKKNANAKLKRRHKVVTDALVDMHFLGVNIKEVYEHAYADAQKEIAKYEGLV